MRMKLYYSREKEEFYQLRENGRKRWTRIMYHLKKMIGKDVEISYRNFESEFSLEIQEKQKECKLEKCISRPHNCNINGEHVRCDNCGALFWSYDAFLTPIGAWCINCKLAEMS